MLYVPLRVRLSTRYPCTATSPSRRPSDARAIQKVDGRLRPRMRCFTSGAYVSGADGSNECPAGSLQILAEAACRAAAAAAGKTVPSTFVETYSISPRGCYYSTLTNCAYFNTHSVGGGSSNGRLLCAVVTTGAPHAPPTRTSARATARRVRSLGGVPRTWGWHYWVLTGTHGCSWVLTRAVCQLFRLCATFCPERIKQYPPAYCPTRQGT